MLVCSYLLMQDICVRAHSDPHSEGTLGSATMFPTAHDKDLGSCTASRLLVSKGRSRVRPSMEFLYSLDWQTKEVRLRCRRSDPGLESCARLFTARRASSRQQSRWEQLSSN